MLADLAPLDDQKGIALACRGNNLVNGSDPLMYRMMFNLVENAIRYSRPASTVDVTVDEEDDRVLVRIEDEGFGIPEQHRDSVFQPFFPRRQVSQQRIRGRRVGPVAGTGNRDASRWHDRSREQF